MENLTPEMLAQIMMMRGLIQIPQDPLIETNDTIMPGFQLLIKKQIKTKENKLYSQLEKETLEIFNYLKETIQKFPKILSKKYNSFNEALIYLKKISIPNNCVCAGIIDTIPGWRCVTCSIYENTIYCFDCYLKSKHLHKNHEVYYCYNSSGMCDCGDPSSLYTFCPDHTGPYTDQKKIDEYIKKIFDNKILENLKKYFDDFFEKISKYLIFTEKIKCFSNLILDETFENNPNPQLREDILLLKKNFAIVFQNILYFLLYISQDNLGMLHLLANYFLKNHFKNGNKLDENYKTMHECFILEKDNIKILNNKNNKENHKCECPFMRLLLSNWRDNIKSKQNENELLILSFVHNLNLRDAFSKIYYCIYEDVLLNSNDVLMINRTQFYLEDTIKCISTKTDLMEKTFEIFYKYFYKFMTEKSSNENDTISSNALLKISIFLEPLMIDTKYWNRPKVKEFMTSKTSIIKRIIDSICLIQQKNKFKSIVPHPQFQNKMFSVNLINLEIFLIEETNTLFLYLDWKNLKKIKEIFNYFVIKIFNKNSEAFKPLGENEFSYHQALYKIFGCFLNFFCFNYANDNKCSLFDSLKYVKKNFFDSEDDIKKLIDIILKDFLKTFAFITAARNGYFNYYESLSNYHNIYFKDSFNHDFTLLKYLIAMSEKKINLDYILKETNIEDIYTFFENVFFNKSIPEQKTKEKSKRSISNNNNNLSGGIPIRMQYNMLNEDLSIMDESRHVMHWIKMFEMVINIAKNDFSLYWNLIYYYKETLSTPVKKYLYENIKKNDDISEDMKNILKERIVLCIMSNNDSIDLKNMKTNIGESFMLFFKEKELNEILDEVTISKMENGVKKFSLKDSSIKYLDLNDYISPYPKTTAVRFILDFKKNIIKLYNNYFIKPSKLTFDLYLKVYENIFLNQENLSLILTILKKLLNEEESSKKYGSINLASINNSFLPTILNYLSIFGCINTKSFVDFKKENISDIKEICEILNKAITSKNLLDKQLQENAEYILNLLKINYDEIKEFKENDYNINKNANLIEENNSNENQKKEIQEKKRKITNIKDHLKKKMLQKADNFVKNIKKDESMEKIIKNESNEKIKEELTNDDIMCFFCRNPINLNTFEKPYGKLGHIFSDYFYENCINSAVKTELEKLKIKNDDILKNINNNKKEQTFRITSCGHYFHSQCFKQGYKRNGFACPLCLKQQNILIPPLSKFYEKENYLNSEKIENIFNEINIDNNKEIDDKNLFKDIVFDFLTKNLPVSINLDQKIGDYEIFLENIFINYKSYINFLENIFNIEGSSFHKYQQIDIIQNFILSLRFLTKINYIDINQITKYIRNSIIKIIKGPLTDEKIAINYDNMYYNNILDKIFLSLAILINYSEIKKIFNYILYWFLPYFTFGFYFRYFVLNNISKADLDINKLFKFFNNNTDMMHNCFKYFLQKLAILKLIIDFNNKNENIINNFNSLSIENLLIELELNNKISINEKNNLLEILKILFNSIKTEESYLNNYYKSTLEYKNLFTLFVNNYKNNKEEKHPIKKELIIPFNQLKFSFINLDTKIFDLIEKTVLKPCIYCHKAFKHYLICLTCGEKLCITQRCHCVQEHTTNCGGLYNLFINMDRMSIFYCGEKQSIKPCILYVNDLGLGPNNNLIGSEFYLNKEKIRELTRDYVIDDIK